MMTGINHSTKPSLASLINPDGQGLSSTPPRSHTQVAQFSLCYASQKISLDIRLAAIKNLLAGFVFSQAILGQGK